MRAQEAKKYGKMSGKTFSCIDFDKRTEMFEKSEKNKKFKKVLDKQKTEC